METEYEKIILSKKLQEEMLKFFMKTSLARKSYPEDTKRVDKEDKDNRLSKE